MTASRHMIALFLSVLFASAARPDTDHSLPRSEPSVVRAVSSVRELTKLNAEKFVEGEVVDVLGYDVPGDGGGGRFFLVRQSDDKKPDGGIVFSSLGHDGWCWQRIPQGDAVNLLWYGAKRDGSEDCAPLVRKAAKHGDVYYPAGTYLQSHVDVQSHRRYFGDGPGRSIIKRALRGGHDRIVFGIATSDFDKSGHPATNIEHVSIEHLTLDFNLANGWVNRPLIQLRSEADTAIRDVMIRDVEFIDSSRVPHPNIFGKKGGDAWCIEASAWNVERFTVQGCVSRAETHQFIAGGRWMRGVRYIDNEIYGGFANGISMTTVGCPARFEDVEISGNRFHGVATGSIYLGYDFGYERPTGSFEMRDIRIRNNLIVLDAPVAYGHTPTPVNFPSAIQIFAGSGGVQNLTISGNSLRVGENYGGGDVNFLKLDRGEFLLKPTATDGEFSQPEPGNTASVKVSPDLHAGRPWATVGALVAIDGGGYYRIERSGPELELLPVGWMPSVPSGTLIPAGAKVHALGGVWSQILIEGNNSSERYLISNAAFRDLTITGNVVDGTIRVSDCQIQSLQCSGNALLQFSSKRSTVAGLLANNTLRPGSTFRQGVLHFDVSRDPLTGLDTRCELLVMGNVLKSANGAGNGDVGIRIQGNARSHGVVWRDNILEGCEVDEVVDALGTVEPAAAVSPAEKTP